MQQRSGYFVPWQVDWRDQVPVVPTTLAQGGPEAAFVSLSGATDWDPHTGHVAAQPLIPGYDPVQLQLVTLGELRAGSYAPWPTHGQQALLADVPELYLAAESGFDVGGQVSGGISPRMIMQAPPTYGDQTTPIVAVGL